MTLRPLVHDLATGTVTVPEGAMGDSVAAYRCLFGYELRHEGRLGLPLARAWGISDPDTQLTPYIRGLGMNPAWRFEAAVGMISRQAGLPLDHVYEFTVLAPQGRTRVEVDRFPADRPMRTHPANELPPGFGLLSFYTSSFDAAVESMENAGYPTVGPVSSVDIPPYNGGRCAVFSGDLGEKIELIERRTKETS